MVSILEPFIDTIIICTLTGLVILSTGVWSEKHENNFQQFDMEFISGQYSDQNEEQKDQLFHYLSNQAENSVEVFDGSIEIIAGRAVTSEHTVLHNRSIAEDVKYYLEGTPYTGSLNIEEGKLTGGVQVSGRSLVHSVDLTSEAFSRGVFGEYGRYIVAIGLVLFAFTTSVAWSYYGDRAMTYLFGVRSVLPYRIIYVACFFTAAVVDTSLVWLIAAITVTFMTLPNLFTIVLLHKEMKQTIADYWEKFHREYPD